MKWCEIYVLKGYENYIIFIINKVAKKSHINDFFNNFLFINERKCKSNKNYIFTKSLYSRIFVQIFVNNILLSKMKKNKYILEIRILEIKDFSIIKEEKKYKNFKTKNIIIDYKKNSNIKVGMKITIADGVFKTFKGHIKEVDNKNKNLKASVKILGKETTVRLNFNQIKILN